MNVNRFIIKQRILFFYKIPINGILFDHSFIHVALSSGMDIVYHVNESEDTMQCNCAVILACNNFVAQEAFGTVKGKK